MFEIGLCDFASAISWLCIIVAFLLFFCPVPFLRCSCLVIAACPAFLVVLSLSSVYPLLPTIVVFVILRSPYGSSGLLFLCGGWLLGWRAQWLIRRLRLLVILALGASLRCHHSGPRAGIWR